MGICPMRYASRLAILLLLSVSLALGQQPSQQAGQQQPGISVEVKVVNILATVRDKKGEIVTNLGKDDFVLDEDGRPQAITYFSQESDLPLTLGLLVDTSGSQRRVLDQERDASYSFLDHMLRDKDMAFLIHFDREVELLQDLTSSHQKLESALRLIDAPPQFADPQNDPTDPGQSGGGGGQRRMGGGASTLLYDGIYLASDEIMKKQQGRKALIVLSDGVDHGSKESLQSAIETAQRADTLVYSILFADEQQSGGFGNGPVFGGMGRRGGGRGGGNRFPEERVDGKKILEQISKETGGRLFEVTKKETMDQIYNQIEEDLRSQYSIGYTPEKSDTSFGYYRKIHLTTKQKGYVVQARDGYYADR